MLNNPQQITPIVFKENDKTDTALLKIFLRLGRDDLVSKIVPLNESVRLLSAARAGKHFLTLEFACQLFDNFLESRTDNSPLARVNGFFTKDDMKNLMNSPFGTFKTCVHLIAKNAFKIYFVVEIAIVENRLDFVSRYLPDITVNSLVSIFLLYKNETVKINRDNAPCFSLISTRTKDVMNSLDTSEIKNKLNQTITDFFNTQLKKTENDKDLHDYIKRMNTEFNAI